MAQKNRANMLMDITTNIFNNVINFITGQNAQDRFVNLLDSAPNILSDKDQANGYVGLDAVGNMFSSYYNENISRANLVTLLTTSTAVGYKYYQIYDADGANYRTLLVMADSNITLYPWAIDLNTSEVGTYNITTDIFVSTLGGIVTTTEAALAALETAGTLSTTVLYMVTDSSPYKLLCKAETASQLSRTAQIVDAVYSGSVDYDVQSGAMYGIAISDSGNKPNQYFGVDPSAWSLSVSCFANKFYSRSSGSLGDNCENNTFEQNASTNTLAESCSNNIFKQEASNNVLGITCINNTFKQGSNNFIFADYFQNVTIEAGTVGADYTASPTYDFLYNNSYPATIFSDGTDNYHRYYEPTNDRIVLTNLTTLAVSYIGGGGGGGGLLSGTATQVSAGTYTATISGAGAYTIGDTYVIKFATANDGASTININTQGAINIFKNTSIPISSGDIKANQTVIIVYDGTNFQAIGLVSSQLLAYVHNAEASTITKGQVVYAFGASGNKMSVKLAKADADATSAKTIGMVYDTSIAAGGEGYIIIQGVIEGLNTAAYTAGDTLYLSGATAGGVTNVKQYAPTHLVYVGIVERANAGNGQIYVRCQNGYELDELHNVSAQTPVDGDTLIYNSTSGLWEANFNEELQLVLTSSFRFLTGN